MVIVPLSTFQFLKQCFIYHSQYARDPSCLLSSYMLMSSEIQREQPPFGLVYHKSHRKSVGFLQHTYLCLGFYSGLQKLVILRWRSLFYSRDSYKSTIIYCYRFFLGGMFKEHGCWSRFTAQPKILHRTPTNGNMLSERQFLVDATIYIDFPITF